MRPLNVRALALAAALAAGPPVDAANVLLVIQNSTIGAEETARRTQFQAWGHTVTTIEDNASQATFDTAIAAADVVYIPTTVQEWELTTKVKAATKGVVCEERYLDIEMGFSTTDGWDASHTNTEVLVNSHAVTSGLATGYVTIVGSSQQLAMMNATVASGMTVLSKQNYSAGSMLGVIETGGALAGGGTAAGRRVRMPWGGDSFAWSALNANGLLIAQQAIAWAAVGSTSNQLVLHLKLDETSGTVADDSSSLNNDGAYLNSPAIGGEGVRGRATRFDGVNDEVQVPGSSTLDLRDRLTVACWAKSDTSTWNNWGCLVAKRDQFVLHPSAGSMTLQFYVNVAGSGWAICSVNLASIAGFSIQEWHHYVGVYDKTTGAIRLFVDGQLLATTTIAAGAMLTPDTGIVAIGSDDYPGRKFAGGIDDVRIYNYALSNAEIAEVHGLIAHWKLNETSGTTAVDTSLSGHNATLTGTTAWTTGQDGGGHDFDYGSGDDYFTAPTTTALDNVQEDDYTVMAYVKPNSIPPGTGSANNGAYAIVSKEGYHLGLIYGAGGEFLMEHWLDGPTYTGAGTFGTSYPPGRFYHVAGVVSRADGTIKIYVDGVLAGTGTFSPGSAARDYGSSRWRIGISGPGASEWGHAADAVIDDARVYNRALSAEELAAYANPGLLAHWKFDEGSGTAIADDSGNGNDAAFNTGTPTWVTGVRGGALEFNGSNDARTTANFDPPAIGSVAFWFRSTAPPTGTERMFGLSTYWEVWVDSDRALRLDFAGPIGGRFVSDSGVAAPGIWRHVVAIYNTNDDTHKLYLDGVLVSSGAFPCEDESEDYLSFGTRTGLTERFNGALDDLRVYNYELTEAEVAELYGLVGHWKFDEGAGTAIADSSGAGAHAAFGTGTPAWVSGVRGNALKFDGSNDALTNADFTPPATGAVSFWVRRDAAQTGQERPFGLGGDWEARQETTGVMAFDLGTSPFAGQPTFETTGVFPGLGQWRHVVAQYDADTDLWELYVDGQYDGGGPHTRDILEQAAARLSFGARTGSTQRFKGALDDFRVYNRWLQPREIADLYGLVGHWKLDETSGSVAADSSPFANHGTYVAVTPGGPGPTDDLPHAPTLTPSGVIELGAANGNRAYNLRETLAIAMWLRPDAVSESWNPFGWEEYDNLETYELRMSDDRSWGLRLNNGPSAPGSVGTAELFAGSAPLGVWQHLAASYDGSSISLYRNGVLVNTAPATGLTLGEQTSAIFLGQQPAGGATAGMADVRLYNRALFPGEARQLYYGEWTPGLRIVKWVEAPNP